MCDRIINAIEVLANDVNKADSLAEAVLGVQDKIIAEVDVIKNAPYFTVFTFAKYVSVKAKDEADARERGQRKLNQIFPGQRNLIVGVCAGKLLRVETPPAATVPVSDNGLVDGPITDDVAA